MIKQEYDYSCGNTLATILKYYYDLEIDEKTVLDGVLELRGLSQEDKKEFENSEMSLSFYDFSKLKIA